MPTYRRSVVPSSAGSHALPLIAIVGVQDGLTDVRAALAAENRTDLLLPLYAALLALFFLYCYPIAWFTRALERRAEVKF